MLANTSLTAGQMQDPLKIIDLLAVMPLEGLGKQTPPTDQLGPEEGRCAVMPQ
jgi:hypothetical protein